MDYREIRKDLGEKEHPTAIKIRKAAEEAIQKLELLDGYADVRAAIAERVSDYYEKHGKSLPRPMVPSDERLEYEISVCEIYAEEFLKLVSDLETVKCYLAILFANAANAWDRYVGIAPIPPNEDHPAVQRIDAHRVPWEIKAWKRIGKRSGWQKGTLAERMEVASRPIGISEFCHRAGISRGSYFNVKNGDATPKTIGKVESYLASTESPNSVQTESK